MHYVIIGNGVAGINAANKIRSQDKTGRITIISYESDHFFSRTALMYVFCGQLSERCVEPYERDYYRKMNFERVRDKVRALDVDGRKIHLESGSSLTYDKLLIASGSVPMTFPWPGIELDGVGNFVSWQDLKWMQKEASAAKNAVVIGGGLIGIEAAEVLIQAGIKTTFLIREDYFWPVALDKNEAAIITEHMREHGCDVRLMTELEKAVGENGRVTAVITKDGEKIATDMIVITIGVKPQTIFLRNSGLEVDERGGIVVNEKLETNLPEVYAAGDCTSVVWFNSIRRPEQLWYTSRDQGRAVGENMAGGDKKYHRATFYNSAKFFDIEYTTAGLVNFNLEGEKNWYQREPNSNFTQRITYLRDDTVAGFNMLGRRWDHCFLVKWIEQKRQLGWVLDNLHQALFDEEFAPPFEIFSNIAKGA